MEGQVGGRKEGRKKIRVEGRMEETRLNLFLTKQKLSYLTGRLQKDISRFEAGTRKKR